MDTNCPSGDSIEIPKFSLVVTESVAFYNMPAENCTRTFFGYKPEIINSYFVYKLQASDYPESVFIVSSEQKAGRKIVMSFTTAGLSEEEINAKTQRVIGKYEAFIHGEETPDTMQFTTLREAKYEDWLKAAVRPKNASEPAK